MAEPTAKDHEGIAPHPADQQPARRDPPGEPDPNVRAVAQLFENSNHGLLWVNATSLRILRCNPAAATMLGRDANDLLGSHLTAIYPDAMRDSFRLLLETQGLDVAHEVEIMDAEGDERTYRISRTSSAKYTHDGTDGFIVEFTILDVTTERAAVRLLTRRTDELWDLSNELKDLTYLISHDLRAPLVNLKGFSGELRCSMEQLDRLLAQQLQQPRADGDPSQHATQQEDALRQDVHEALSFIDSSVARMDRMISLLLAWSRLGRMDVRLELFEVAPVVEEVAQSLQRQVREGNASVVIGDLPTVTADKGALEQIFGNLVDNALRYLRTDEPGRVEISCERRDKKFVFRVMDNGCGMTPQEVESIFTPFKRFAKNGTPGEGMGLTYTRTLVARHFGQIWCDSTPGIGSTFSFTIPENVKEEIAHAPGGMRHDSTD